MFKGSGRGLGLCRVTTLLIGNHTAFRDVDMKASEIMIGGWGLLALTVRFTSGLLHVVGSDLRAVVIVSNLLCPETETPHPHNPKLSNLDDIPGFFLRRA